MRLPNARSDVSEQSRPRAFHEKWFRPNHATLIVVGDRAKVEAGIRELNLGELTIIDADCKPATQ